MDQKYKQPGSFIVFAVLVSALVILWSLPGFVTGDGACHVHNAIAWRELLTHPGSYYEQVYTLNNRICPNYVSHVLLAFLTLLFSPAIAEKAMLSLYAYWFVIGFFRLHKQVQAQNSMVLPVLLLLVFQSLLYLGFYNFILSIALYMMLLAWYLKKEHMADFFFWIQCSLAALILFFTHLSGLFLWMASVGLYSLTKWLDPTLRGTMVRKALYFLCSCLPALDLTFNFIRSQKTEAPVHYFDQATLYRMLKEASVLQAFHLNEIRYTQWLFPTLLVGLLLSLFVTLRQEKWRQRQLWPFLLLGICIWAYFYAPENAFGGEQIKQRLQWVIFILAILVVSFPKLPKLLQVLGTVFGVMFVAALVRFQYPSLQRSSLVAEDIMKAGQFVKTNRTVLPLCFNTSGYIQKQVISDFVRHGNHVGAFILGDKDLIFMDNYEANTDYFPLRYRDTLNPFQYLGDQEAQPPKITLSSYNRRHVIDYVLLFDLKPEDISTEAFQNLQTQLNPNYREVFRNQDSSVRLYSYQTTTP